MSAASSLSIEILEQPAEFYRFRYESEVGNNRVAGILYGRRSTDGSKTYVRFRATGIDPSIHHSVTVIGGTVNPDGYPHPYFLFGDGCQDGVFQLKTDVASLGDRREIVKDLTMVSIVCVNTRVGGLSLRQAIQRRRDISFNPKLLNMDSIKYTVRNLKPLCLIFQVFYEPLNSNGFGIATDAVAMSLPIQAAKDEVRLAITGIHPNTVPVSGVCEIWVYSDSRLPHHNQANRTGLFRAEIQSADYGRFSCYVGEIREHLIVVRKPDASVQFAQCAEERIRCRLCIEAKSGPEVHADGHWVTEQHDIILIKPPEGQSVDQSIASSDDPPPGKRKRAAPSSDSNQQAEILQFFAPIPQ